MELKDGRMGLFCCGPGKKKITVVVPTGHDRLPVSIVRGLSETVYQGFFPGVKMEEIEVVRLTDGCLGLMFEAYEEDLPGGYDEVERKDLPV
jgi:hypothetical protein